MGNACCGGGPTLPAQPGLPLQSAQVLHKVLEFSESSRTTEPLKDLETDIETLQCEIDSLEGDFILARNSAETSLDRLEKDLEAMKYTARLHSSEHTAEEKAFYQNELLQWQLLVESQGLRLAEAAAKARQTAATLVQSKLHIVKGRAAGFQKQIYHWKAREPQGSLFLGHIGPLELKFTNIIDVIEGLERRLQVLKEAHISSELAERSQAFLDAVFWYQTKSDSEILTSITETKETLPQSDNPEKETAVLEEQTEPKTPISEPQDSMEGGDFAFPMLLEVPDLPELVAGLYSERQELRELQERSELRRLLQAHSPLKGCAWDPHTVQSLFLRLVHRKHRSDQELTEAGALPLSMDTFVLKYFEEEHGQEADSALLSFLQGLWSAQSANFPGSLLISRVLNVFTAQPYPLPLAQLLPSFLQSFPSPSESIPLLEIMEKLSETLNPAETLEVLRVFRPDSLTEGEFLVLLCCHRMHKLRIDHLFRLLAGDSDFITSESLVSGLFSQLQLPFLPSEQEALLSAVNSAGSNVISRLKFNKVFNSKQIREAGQRTQGLAPLAFAEKAMEMCLIRRRRVIMDLEGKTGNWMEEIAAEEDQSGAMAREIAGKGFGEALAVLERHLAGPFHQAYCLFPAK